MEEVVMKDAAIKIEDILSWFDEVTRPSWRSEIHDE